MNTPTMGYHYRLAPDAEPDDGEFELVLIHANQREKYLKFIKAVLTGSLQDLPDVSIQRGRKLEIAWRGFPLHLDGTATAGLDGVDLINNPSHNDEPEMLDVAKPFIRVELASQAVHFCVPRKAVAMGAGAMASG
jgi:hypothetical protein